MLHRLKYAQDHPTELKIRMYDVTNPVNNHTIDNTDLLNIFNQAVHAWDQAMLQDAPMESLKNIIHRAREQLRMEVWRVD